MYIIMGGTGHVGSATAQALLSQSAAVSIISHDHDTAQGREAKGAEVIIADVGDPASLRAAFQQGKRAFLLNPPADPSTDTDAVERQSVANILSALADSGLEKVVAASVGGARPGERIGDLSILWQLEEGLRAQPIPAAINRGGYYMSNFDELLDPVRESGELPTMFPADKPLPIVAPADLGEAAAKRLMSDLDDVGVVTIEGPELYTFADVADAFARALDRPVTPKVTPRDQLVEGFEALGFSDAAAQSYARMTAATIDADVGEIEPDIRGTVTLQAYIDALVKSR